MGFGRAGKVLAVRAFSKGGELVTPKLRDRGMEPYGVDFWGGVLQYLDLPTMQNICLLVSKTSQKAYILHSWKI